MDKIDVGVMITYYHPDINSIKETLKHIEREIDYICIVDNSPQDVSDITQLVLQNFQNVRYMALCKNIGIAAAQNIGARYLFDKVQAVIFLDQDSLPAAGMIDSLIQSYEKLLSLNQFEVGAVGPQTINSSTNEPYKAKIKKGIPLKEDQSILRVTELISSGTLIPKLVWEITGGMDESLFIDAVDHEWCWRATEKWNFSFFIDEKAKLFHALGEGDKNIIGPLRIRSIPKPIRCYYLYRNFFLLIRRKYVPFYWKSMNSLKLFAKLILYPIFLSERKEYIKYIIRGIFDGVRKKGGAFI